MKVALTRRQLDLAPNGFHEILDDGLVEQDVDVDRIDADLGVDGTGDLVCGERH